jgi:hypothetical protein
MRRVMGRRTFRSRAVGTMAVIGLGMAAAAAAVSAAGDTLVVLDGPRGAWLGEVRGDAPFQVIEEKDGWRHVRLEGWIHAGPAVSGGAAARSATMPAPPGSGSLSGILTPLPGMDPATLGTNLVVWLLGDPDRLDADHKALGEECRRSLAAIDQRIAGLDEALRHALNSSDNFRQAASNNDHAKSDLAAAQKSRDREIVGCRERADQLFSTRALARTLSDGSGRFEFQGIAAGTYRIVATERNGTAARGWTLRAEVNGEAPIVVEARAAAGPDPYWNLR